MLALRFSGLTIQEAAVTPGTSRGSETPVERRTGGLFREMSGHVA